MATGPQAWPPEGTVVQHTDGPWLDRLELDLEAATAEGRLSAGLRFRMVPLFVGRRRAETVLYAAARDELFITSMFNPRVNAQQDAT